MFKIQSESEFHKYVLFSLFTMVRNSRRVQKIAGTKRNALVNCIRYRRRNIREIEKVLKINKL